MEGVTLRFRHRDCSRRARMGCIIWEVKIRDLIWIMMNYVGSSLGNWPKSVAHI